MMPSTEHRRANDRSWFVVAFQWTFAFLVDGWHGISLARLMAIAFAAVVCFVSIATKTIGAGAVTLSVFSLATAFGKTVFQAALNRWSGATASNESVTLSGDIAAIMKVVRGRRDPEKGMESTP